MPVRAALHFIAAGHYATETFGVRRLGELVAERFGVEHEFIDVPNPDSEQRLTHLRILRGYLLTRPRRADKT